MWMPPELLRSLKASGERKPIRCALAEVEFITAAGDGDTPGPKKFSLVGYTGGQMRVDAFFRPVVIDLAGLKPVSAQIPALLGHNPEKIVGHGEPEISAQRVKLSGVVSGGGPAAEEVRLAAANGFPWKASVGVFPEKVEFVDAGSKATANGKTWQGPINIVRGGTLYEISFVPIAADSKTSVSVAADAAKGITMSDEHEHELETIRASEAASIEEKERRRINAIKAVCGSEHADIAAKAISRGWTDERTELEILRASRSKPPNTVPQGQIQRSAIECAFARSCGVDVERHFKPEVLEAADDRRLRGFGLQQLLLQAAAENGYECSPGTRIRNSNLHEILRFAFPGGPPVQGGFSTHSLTTLLSTTGNKMLLDGFMSVPQSWRQVAAVKTVNDFKEVTAYRMNADLEYEEVGAAAEIEHGTLSQETYTMQAKTYAKMLVLTRTDIINDDLSAFDDLRNRLGLGAAIKMNKVFWTLWLSTRNAGTFWTQARGNFVTSCALGSSGMSSAVQAFRDMDGPDGNLLNLEPKFVIVPSALEYAARSLYVSAEIRDTTDDTAILTGNVYKDLFLPVIVPEMGNSSYTGYSATTWHLAADPARLASAVMCFLGGVQQPTIESAEADFNVLGVQFRGYHDFGAAMSEYRASVQCDA